MLTVICPKCRLQFQVDRSLAGRRTTCGRCSTGFHVPSAGQVREDPNAGGHHAGSHSFAGAPAGHFPPHHPAGHYPHGGHSGQFECPYCHTRSLPYARSQISTAGWVIFAVLLVIFFPLCFIGLLITESYYACSRCGARLSW